MSFSSSAAIHVDNLAAGTTAEDVELVFEDYGKILSCELIESKYPDASASRILYDNEDAANDAVESVE
jgi:RNA recognition motif-containing protein